MKLKYRNTRAHIIAVAVLALSLPVDYAEAQESVPTAIEVSPIGAPSNAPNLAEPKLMLAPLPQLQPKPETAPVDATEARVLVTEVVVDGVEGALQDEIYKVVKTKPGKTSTKLQLQEDIDAIFATGYFANVRAVPKDTPLGVRVTFAVQPNPVLRSVQLQGNRVIPATVVQESFSEQYGNVLNLLQLQTNIKKLTKWYQDNGYVLAQVTNAPQIAADGTVTLDVTEGTIEDVQVRFLNKNGEDKNANGKPIRGHTRDFIVTREMQVKSGDVFNQKQVEKDLQRVFSLGLFEDVKLSLSPGQDPYKAIVVVNVVERSKFSFSPGAGYSSASGLFAAGSVQVGNLGGNNQNFAGEVQLGQRSLAFDVTFTDPWIAGDPFRTAYSVSAFKRETIPLVFDGGKNQVKLPNGDRPRVDRTGGGVIFTRPLTKNVFEKPEWIASAGLQYQRVSVRDGNGKSSPRDEKGNPLSFSGSGTDDLLTIPFALVQDQRNDGLRPTQGSLLRLSTEQSIPIGEGSLLFNRLRGNYSFFLPTQLLHFTQGCQKLNPTTNDCPQTFAFNLQGGTVFGDLPPYEAFALGGSSSVRGYNEGDLGSARSFLQATAEYRFPVFSVISGALFFDAATDLGSGSSVPGDPAGVRGKPGSGYGYGLGVRIQSPLGPIRLDYGISDQGDRRFQFGIGERF